eukprot:2096650-Ditylum_brightwellii.AAC.1
MQKVIIASCTALPSFGVMAARNEDAEKLQIVVVENYFLEKCIPTPRCGHGSKGQTGTPDMG